MPQGTGGSQINAGSNPPNMGRTTGNPIPLVGVAQPQAQTAPQMGAPDPFANQPHYAPYVSANFMRGRRQGRLAGIIIALVALSGLAFLGKMGYGLWVGAKQANANLAVNGGNSPANLSIESQVPPPNLSVLDNQKQMPADIYNWLQHLQRCDMYKREITQKQDVELSALIPQLRSSDGLTSAADVDKMTDPDSNFKAPPGTQLLDKEIKKMESDWSQLKARFDKVPPPKECQAIADAYDAGLSDTVATAQEIDTMAGGVDVTDPNLDANIETTKNGLSGIGKNHAAGIDNMFAQTDMLVQQICDKYSVSKWFSIDIHGGNQDAFQNFGF